MERRLSTTASFLAAAIAAALILAACTGGGTPRTAQPADTLYTEQRAMDIYDYQPGCALRIVDSAVIVGNLSEVRGDIMKARIYCWSVMGTAVDSLLHGPEGVRFDSARAVGERLLTHDAIRADLPS